MATTAPAAAADTTGGAPPQASPPQGADQVDVALLPENLVTQNQRQSAAPVVDEAGELVRERFLHFLQNFETDQETEDETEDMLATSPYVSQVLSSNFKSTVFIDHAHIRDFDNELAEALENEYVRFEPFLRASIEEFVTWVRERENIPGGEVTSTYYPSFFNLPNILPLRGLRTSSISRLVSFCATITRTSDVYPELLTGTYRCERCGHSEENMTQKPSICRNDRCGAAQTSGEWMLVMESSVFVDWQRVRVQEVGDEVPTGCMPRGMEVVLRGEMVESAGVKAGVACMFTGSLVVLPEQSGGLYETPQLSQNNSGVTGLKAFGCKELSYRMCFVANSAIPLDMYMNFGNTQTSSRLMNQLVTSLGNHEFDVTNQEAENFSRSELDIIRAMKTTSNLYSLMTQSICPETFGHLEVKRGILLMLLGGVHKTTNEGMKLRGDLNVCLVGDPSVAKSKFLKFVHSFTPRGVYTSGKATSAAGLTAAVVREEDTGDFVIEAGALMLADNGICCIDEFDKMDVVDQVAIHEAMEQQTISITKAGIHATLNARASILAAANPIYGRYDRTKTLKANVALTAPILSRFDLFFVILDECDELADYNVAKHILDVHRRVDQALNPPFTKQQLQLYIRFARMINPTISPESQKVLVDCYRQLRQGDTLGRSRTAYRITVRQLESLIRLSEALARLHLDVEIKPSYVRESFRLLRKSIIHVETEDVTLEDDADLQGKEVTDDENEKTSTVGADDDYLNNEKEEDKNTPPVEEQSRPTKKQKTQITFEQYQTIAKAIAHHLRFLEEQSVDGSDNEADDKKESEEEEGSSSEHLKEKLKKYLTRGKVIEWYLEQCEGDIGDSEEELERLKKLTTLVVQRLIDKDRVLVYVGDYSEETPRDEIEVAVHPNFVLD